MTDERTAEDPAPELPEEPADDSWSEGQTNVGDVVQEPVEFDPLTEAFDAAGADDDAEPDDVPEETPTLGGPLPG